MSGAPVVLPDGRLAGIVVEASPQTRQLFFVAISDVVTHADSFHVQLDRVTGVATVVEVRDARRYRAALAIDSLDESGRPRRVDAQDSLAAFGVKRADTYEHGGFLTYVMRDRDGPTTAADGGLAPGLREVLRAAAQDARSDAVPRVVLVEGSAAAGKSRSAAEAAIAELGARLLLSPIPGPHALQLIRDWPVEDLCDAVIWLDNVERYTEPALGETFRRLLRAGAVVVATIRTERLREMTDTGPLENPAGLTLKDKDVVVKLHWEKNWSATERAAVQVVLETPSAKQAVADGTPLGVWAIAGRQLLEKYEDIQQDDNYPEQGALVRAILDWYRAGHTRGIPRAVLSGLLQEDANPDGYGGAAGYLPSEIDSAIDELAQPLVGVVREGNALLICERTGDGLRIHDYVRDVDATAPREIPRVMWQAATTHATDLEILFGVGYAAYQAGMFDIIEPKFEYLAEQGITAAQANLGVMLHELGRDSEAEAWWRRAAEAGHAGSQVNLGLMLHEVGKDAEAEVWWRRAAEAGQNDAKFNLGLMRHELGKDAEAEVWWRRAAEAGHAGSQNSLGLILQDRGELGKAEAWYRRAADAGHTGAKYNLGLMFDALNKDAEAETWWRRAAEAGQSDAQNSLGVILWRRGEVGEAEVWWRSAAEAGHADAQKKLLVILKQRAEAGDTGAQVDLGLILTEAGRHGQAEVWWRRAAEAGHTGAQYNLGLMLHNRGEVDEAEVWWRRAAKAGQSDAQYDLGVTLYDRGQVDEAEVWWRRAAEAGHTDAQHNLGVILKRRVEAGEAET